jgi:iron complex transport system substrate-binding protein
MRRDVDEVARLAVDCGLKVHRELGPGLLESAYEACLAHSLNKCGLFVERQKTIPIHFDGIAVEAGFRADLLVEGQLLLELKSADAIAPVHVKQVLTYLRLMNLQVGFIFNFGASTFRDGCRRLVNDYVPRAGTPSRP